MAEESNAFVEYGTKARAEHIKYTDSPIDGFIAFECDTDVYLGLWGKTVPKGKYYLLADDMLNGREKQDAAIYLITVDTEHMFKTESEAETVEENDIFTVKAFKGETNLNLTMEPMEIVRGQNLFFLEYIAWLAMTVAESDEIRDAIFQAAYKVEVKDDTPKQTSRRASKRYDPVTKLHQSITDPEIYSELGLTLNVAGRNEKKGNKKVETLVALEYVSDDENIELTRRVSDFDIQVYNAVCSLWEAGKDEFTLQELFEMTIGKGKAKRDQLERLSDSVEILRKTRLTADITQEARAHNLVDPETGKPWEQMEIDDFLLTTVRIRMKSVNGKWTTGYKLNSLPILLRYAKASKQIVSYPVKYLDTKSAGSNTERNVVIRGYLLQRIAQAKGGKMPNTIRCERIYKKAGINADNRTERRRVDKYISGLLEVWREQGLFTTYEVISEGQRRMSKIVINFAK